MSEIDGVGPTNEPTNYAQQALDAALRALETRTPGNAFLLVSLSPDAKHNANIATNAPPIIFVATLREIADQIENMCN